MIIPPNPDLVSFAASHAPYATVSLGIPVTFETSAAKYETITVEALESGQVDFRQVNALTGPVYVESAQPGDALGVAIEEIRVEGVAYAPYIPRWRAASFGRTAPMAERFRISDEGIHLTDSIAIPLRPMVCCIGVAPAMGSVSSLSPCSPTGGNLDLIELQAGATIWLPVQVEGALFALGDLHGRMGRGEPAGVGLEAGGSVTVRFSLSRSADIELPIIRTNNGIHFVGTDRTEMQQAEQRAVLAGYEWLKAITGLDDDRAFPLAAAMMHLNAGGPAGANVVASFVLSELAEAGIDVGKGEGARGEEGGERGPPPPSPHCRATRTRPCSSGGSYTH
jgi:amidase